MKKLLLIWALLFLSMPCFAQSRYGKFSISMSNPIPTGNNFINKNLADGYLGVIDFGAAYNFYQRRSLGIGIQFNSTFLSFSEINEQLTIFSPKLRLEYAIKRNKVSLVPNIAVGYSSWRFRAPRPDFSMDRINVLYRYNQMGATVRGGAKLVFDTSETLKWYAEFSYEKTRLENKFGGGLNQSYIRNIEMMYPGFGFIWKFKRK